MRASRVIHVVSAHAEGEVGDVIVGGVASPPGDTLWEQSRFIANDGRLRNFVLNEPRGGVFRHVNLFVIVDARALGFSPAPDEARDIAVTGVAITRAASEQIGFTHPGNPEWSHVSFCQMAAPVEVRDGVKTGRNAVAIRPGKIDRSPCGTGCSARLAVLHARGEFPPGEPFVGISPIDSRFDCRIESLARVGDRQAVVPSLRVRAWITGTHQHTLDPGDPWPEGYRLSDTWPRMG